MQSQTIVSKLVFIFGVFVFIFGNILKKFYTLLIMEIQTLTIRDLNDNKVSLPKDKKKWSELSPKDWKKMWKSSVGTKNVVIPSLANGDDEDDWETDPDYVNEMSEEQQRWGGARDTGVLE